MVTIKNLIRSKLLLHARQTTEAYFTDKVCKKFQGMSENEVRFYLIHTCWVQSHDWGMGQSVKHCPHSFLGIGVLWLEKLFHETLVEHSANNIMHNLKGTGELKVMIYKYYSCVKLYVINYMLQAKIKFKLKFFNLGWFSNSLSPSPKRQRKLRINLGEMKINLKSNLTRNIYAPTPSQFV